MTPFIRFYYTNHRGHNAIRTVVPLGIRFGESQWYPERQWLLRAFDMDRLEEREFAFVKMEGVQEGEFRRDDD